MHDIAINGLTKAFGPNTVLHGIDLVIPAGEFVGLMGPNGAGKSTLIKILDGVYERTSGVITYAGQPVRNLAERNEVGFIHQDLGLVDDLTIVDNLRLGETPMRLAGPVLNRRAESAAAAVALARVELERSPDTLVGELSPGEKTLVAVARLLDKGARVLFIDEATSTLPPADSQRLIATLEQTVAKGATVIMVSHKLSEILRATHRVVLLLDGKVAADVRSSELDRDRLVSMLVSHEAQGRHERRAPREPGEEVLRIERAWGGRAGPVDLTVRAGEVVGVTGLPGSGLHDIGYLAHGSMRPTAGRVTRPGNAAAALVPPHRETQGGFVDLPVQDNLTVSALHDWVHPVRTIRRIAERRAAEGMVERLSVKPADCHAPFGVLSGGNKQKVIFGRVLFRRPRLYVLCEPTRGVDIGTRNEIYRLIDRLRDEDAGVLIVTSDSEDLFAVCDRIAIVEDGRVGDFLPVDETNPQELEAFI